MADTTPEAVPVSSEEAEGQGTVPVSTGIKDVLSQALGKAFPSDEAALKAVKDTFSFVGKAGNYQATMKGLTAKFGDEQTVLKKFNDFMSQNSTTPESSEAPNQPDFMGEVRNLKAQLEERDFFSEKPELKPYAPLLRELRGTSNKSLAEVASSESFKALADKALAYEKDSQSRSVLHSNPRLGAAQDKMTQARELQKSNPKAARAAAVSAVLDAYKS